MLRRILFLIFRLFSNALVESVQSYPLSGGKWKKVSHQITDTRQGPKNSSTQTPDSRRISLHLRFLILSFAAVSMVSCLADFCYNKSPEMLFMSTPVAVWDEPKQQATKGKRKKKKITLQLDSEKLKSAPSKSNKSLNSCSFEVN